MTRLEQSLEMATSQFVNEITALLRGATIDDLIALGQEYTTSAGHADEPEVDEPARSPNSPPPRRPPPSPRRSAPGPPARPRAARGRCTRPADRSGCATSITWRREGSRRRSPGRGDYWASNQTW